MPSSGGSPTVRVILNGEELRYVREVIDHEDGTITAEVCALKDGLPYLVGSEEDGTLDIATETITGPGHVVFPPPGTVTFQFVKGRLTRVESKA